MIFINQNDYPNEPYPTHMELPEHPSHNNSIADAGCGLCSACMMVDRLTTETLPLLECRDISMACKGNHDSGTNMLVLGPVIAEKYGLTMTTSNDIEDLKKCLQEGGCAILNPGGDHEDGYVGVFTRGGHYIVAISVKDDEFCILDPSLRPDKFDMPERKGKVRVEGKFCYTSSQVILDECSNRDPGFYLFRRNSDR